MSDMILLGTRKGIVIVERSNSAWRPRPIEHAGIPVCYAARDPRNGTWWASLDHGHCGPKLSRSRDGGASWEDISSLKYLQGARYIVKYLPTPDFDPSAPASQPEYKDATVYKIWTLAFGHAEQPGRLYAGAIPGGLFVSDGGGDTWELNRPLRNHESRGGDLFAGDAISENRWGGTPASIDYGVFEPGIHSIVVDPRNAQHMHVAVSSAGVLETVDGGRTWEGRNRGVTNDYLPNPEAEWGHDPHFIAACPAQPEHLWQQNHCGVFYSDDGAQTWKKVSVPDAGVHFGFPIAADAREGRTAWVVPRVRIPHAWRSPAGCAWRAPPTAGNPGKYPAAASRKRTPTTSYCGTASTWPAIVSASAAPPATSTCPKTAATPGNASATTFRRCIRYDSAREPLSNPSLRGA